MTISEARPIRRTRAQIDAIKASIYELLAQEAPCTVRQVFYRLVSAGVIGKTEGEYKSTVVRLLGEMRRNHEINFSWIADNTRWMRKPSTFSSLEMMLKRSADVYRRSVLGQPELLCRDLARKGRFSWRALGRNLYLGRAVNGYSRLSFTLLSLLSRRSYRGTNEASLSLLLWGP